MVSGGGGGSGGGWENRVEGDENATIAGGGGGCGVAILAEAQAFDSDTTLEAEVDSPASTSGLPGKAGSEVYTCKFEMRDFIGVRDTYLLRSAFGGNLNSNEIFETGLGGQPQGSISPYSIQFGTSRTHTELAIYPQVAGETVTTNSPGGKGADGVAFQLSMAGGAFDTINVAGGSGGVNSGDPLTPGSGSPPSVEFSTAGGGGGSVVRDW